MSFGLEAPLAEFYSSKAVRCRVCFGSTVSDASEHPLLGQPGDDLACFALGRGSVKID